MGEDHTDEPQANHERLTVAQAAATLGITEGAVRSRIKRGTLPTMKEGGTVFVLWGSGSSASGTSGTSAANQPPNTGVPTDHTEELIRTLREQLELERQAHAEARRLLAAALERIPPQLEAPRGEESSPSETPPEASESPEMAESPGTTSPAPHSEGPATRYAAAIALMGIVLAAGLSLLTGEGYWGPWDMLTGALLLLVLWAVPLDWVEHRFGRYSVWPAAFGLCAYAAVAYPFAWVLATFFDSKTDVGSVQDTHAFAYGGMALLIGVVVLGWLIAYWRTHRATSSPQEAAQPQGTPRSWWRRMFGG